MSCTFRIYPEHALIVERCSGRVTRAEFMEMVEEVWKDPRYDKSFRVIVDFRRSKLEMSIGEIADFCRPFLESAEAARGPAAILVSTPMETALGMLIGKMMTEVQPVQVFSTWEGACGYLGIEGFSDHDSPA